MRLVNRLFGKLLYYIPNLNLIWKQIPEGNLRVGRERHKHVIRTDEYLSLSIHIAGEENGNPHQYSCLENPTDGGAWWATVHGVTKSQTWLTDFILFSLSYTYTHIHTNPNDHIVSSWTPVCPMTNQIYSYTWSIFPGEKKKSRNKLSDSCTLVKQENFLVKQKFF